MIEPHAVQHLNALRNFLHGAPMTPDQLAGRLKRVDAFLQANHWRLRMEPKPYEYYLDLATRLIESRKEN